MKTICYLFIVALFIYSCKSSPKKEYEIKYSVINTTDTLNGEVIELDSIISPALISCVDRYLVLLNTNEPLFNIYQSSNDSLLCQIGTIGHSKNEFSTHALDYLYRKDNNGDILMDVQDIALVRVVNLTSSIKEKRVIVEDVYHPGDFQITDCNQSFFIDKDHVVHFYQTRFEGDVRDHNILPTCVTLQSGKTTDTLYTNPFLITDCNDALANVVNHSLWQVKPDHSKFVVYGYLQDYFTITDIATKKTIIVENDNHRDFHDEVKGLVKGRHYKDAIRDLKIANVFISTSDDYLFLMYDGKYTPWDMENGATLVPEVRIYDWNGDFISSFFLKEEIADFAYNDVVNKFYALECKTDRILQYDISKYLKKK